MIVLNLWQYTSRSFLSKRGAHSLHPAIFRPPETGEAQANAPRFWCTARTWGANRRPVIGGAPLEEAGQVFCNELLDDWEGVWRLQKAQKGSESCSDVSRPDSGFGSTPVAR